MNIETLASFLGWCTLINYGVLLLWFLGYISARESMVSLHSRWFPLTDAQFTMVNYCGMGLYKLLIFVFCLAPYLVLRLAM
ncbi:MAG: hypothetical protein ACJA0N_000382 [Pseudohongiellaceae bacterium]|jgi:hypothetical protein